MAIIDEIIIFLSSLEGQKNAVSSILEELEETSEVIFKHISDNEEVYQFLSCYAECQKNGILFHPSFLGYFKGNYCPDLLIKNWDIISQNLLNDFPHNLDNGNRKKRYKEILDCQTNRAYTAVCRSVYVELEALLREEMLLDNKDWLNKYKKHSDIKKKKGFLQQQFSELVKSKHSDIKLHYKTENKFLSMLYCDFVKNVLLKVYCEFDHDDINNRDNKISRHFYIHGWAEDTSIIDGLNGIIIFDYALKIVNISK